MGQVDPYTDSDTGVLRNRVGADTQAALDAAEGDLVFTRAQQLLHNPVQATGDLDELRGVHGHLFQDVYEWAGRTRTVDMRKNVEGTEPFLPAAVIDRASVYVAAELRDDGMLQAMSRDRFIERLAYHYEQVNYMHPFREGNGRTRRMFWSRVAEEAGWLLDWRAVSGAVNDAACRDAAEYGDFQPLEDMFNDIVIRPGGFESDAAGQAARLAGLGFPDSARRADRFGGPGEQPARGASPGRESSRADRGAER